MIRIAITAEAFDAIARTMPFGSVNFEAGVDDKGERYIWLPRAVVDRLAARSNRAIAAEIGVGTMTVSRYRSTLMAAAAPTIAGFAGNG